MASGSNASPARFRVVAVVCLLALVTTSLGHVAHNLDLAQQPSSSGIYSASPAICPACVALQSSVAEAEYSGVVHQTTIRFTSRPLYQNPLPSGEFLPFFVRPPPAV